MGSRRALIAIALIVSAGTARVASAEPKEQRVAIAPSSCATAAFDEAAFRYLARVEIEGAGRAVTETDEGDVVIAVTCSADGRLVTIAATSPRTGEKRSRDVSLDGIDPSARPRALALVAAELVARASDAGAPPAPPPPPPPAPSPPAAPPTPKPVRAPAASAPPPTLGTDAEKHVAVAASLDGRSLPEMSAGLIGPTVQGRYRLSAIPVAVGADVSYLIGAGHDTLGTVQNRLVAVGLEAAFVVATPHVVSTIGPRVEVGRATVEGQPAYAGVAASSSTATVVLGTIVAALATRRDDGVFVVVAAEAGTTLEGLNAYADDRRVTGVGGPVLGIALGVGVEL